MLARPEGQTQTWTQLHELLASGLEVMSVTAAEHRFKKPIEVPRPRPPRKPRGRRHAGPQPGEVSLDEAMRAFAANGRVRKPGQVAAR